MYVTVNLDEIKPNPYRNFDIYPLDNGRVEALMDSFRRNGDFGILPARQLNEDVFEIAAGHHRLEAMRKLKTKTVSLKVEEYTDDQMISIMADENSKQGGGATEAAVDVVAAALERLTYLVLTGDKQCSMWVGNDDKVEAARKKILNSRTLSEIYVFQYLDKKLTVKEIKRAYSVIFASKIYVDILDRVQEALKKAKKKKKSANERAQREVDKAEQAELEAKQKADEAISERQKRIAKRMEEEAKAKREKAEAKASKSAKDAKDVDKADVGLTKTKRKAKEKVVFDPSCLHLFPVTPVAIAFREAVVELGDVVPVDVQFRMGKALKERMPVTLKLTPELVRAWVTVNHVSYMAGAYTIDDPDKLLEVYNGSEDTDRTSEEDVKHYIGMIMSAESGLTEAVTGLSEVLQSNPKLASKSHISQKAAKVIKSLRSELSALSLIVSRIEYK